MKVHQLKIWPEHFEAVTNVDPLKRKSVEIRKDDRGFEVSDKLILNEYNNAVDEYTGRAVCVTITHILRGEEWLQPGYVALSIRQFPESDVSKIQVNCIEREQKESIKEVVTNSDWRDIALIGLLTTGKISDEDIEKLRIALKDESNIAKCHIQSVAMSLDGHSAGMFEFEQVVEQPVTEHNE